MKKTNILIGRTMSTQKCQKLHFLASQPIRSCSFLIMIKIPLNSFLIQALRTIHITNQKLLLNNIRSQKFSISIADQHTVDNELIGDVTLQTEFGLITLTDVAYSTHFKVNLISIPRLIKAGAIVQFIDNNIIMPRVVASKVKINGLFSIIVVFIGGALWGVSGMFLSIPVTAILKVIFDRVPMLEPFGYVLGDTMPPLLVRKKKKKLKSDD